MRHKKEGFTLIELVIFIAVMAIMATAILAAFNSVMRGTSTTKADISAAEAAAGCLENYFGQRSIAGFNSIPLGTITAPNLPATCTVPSGYTATITISNYAFDSNYKQIQVAITGLVSLTMSLLVANY